MGLAFLPLAAPQGPLFLRSEPRNSRHWLKPGVAEDTAELLSGSCQYVFESRDRRSSQRERHQLGLFCLQQNLKRRWPERLRFSNRNFSPPAAATTRSAGTFAWSAFRRGALPFDFPLILNQLTAV